MRVAAIVAGVCGVAAIAFLLLVWGRARALAARAKALGADPLEPPSGAAPLAAARAVHLRTLVGAEDACLADFPNGLAGDFVVTEKELALGPLHVPLARVVEAVFLPEFEGNPAEPQGIFVRVQWERGGVRLASVFRVDGRRVDAERLRKEIHLRAGMAPRPPLPDGLAP